MNKCRNVIYFENGIKHEFTNSEIEIIKRALTSLGVISDDEKESYESLISLFVHHLD